MGPLSPPPALAIGDNRPSIIYLRPITTSAVGDMPVASGTGAVNLDEIFKKKQPREVNLPSCTAYSICKS